MRRKRNGQTGTSGTPLWMLDLMFLTAGALAWLLFYFILRMRVESDPLHYTQIVQTDLPPAYAGEPYHVRLSREGTCRDVAWKLQDDAPAWLSLDPVSGELSGTAPETATKKPETALFQACVNSMCRLAGHQEWNNRFKQFMLEVRRRDVAPPRLQITTKELPAAIAGQRYEVRLTAIGGYPFEAQNASASYEWELAERAAELKERYGLGLDLRNGLLSGTVPESAIGKEKELVIPLKLRVHDSTGAVAETAEPVTLVVKALVAKDDLRIVTPAEPMPIALAGEPYCVSFSAEGGRPPHTWTCKPSKPADWRKAGLQLTNDGILKGVPKIDSEEDQTLKFSVGVQDSSQPPASANLPVELLISRRAKVHRVELLTKSFPDAEVGQDYVIALSARHGLPPYDWKIDGLPPEFKIEDSVLGGKPTKAGDYAATLRVTDRSSSQAKEVAFKFRARNVTPVEELRIVTPERLPTAVVGDPYEVRLAAEGGRLPHMWRLEGAWPPELAQWQLTEDGRVVCKSVPAPLAPEKGTEAADPVVVIGVKDASGQQKTRKFAVNLKSAMETQRLRILTDELPKVRAGERVRLFLSATGGVPGYTWTAKWGEPVGVLDEKVKPQISLIQQGFKGDGTLEFQLPAWEPGQPPMRVPLEVTAADTRVQSATDTKKLELTILSGSVLVPPLSITTNELPPANEGLPYGVTIAPYGGVAGYSWELQGALPPGLSFDEKSGTIHGEPEASGDSDVFTVVVTDTNANTAKKNYQLSVLPKPPDAAALLGAALQPWWKYLGFLAVAIIYVIVKQGVNDRSYRRRHDSLLQQGARYVDEGGRYARLEPKPGVSKAVFDRLAAQISHLQDSNKRRVRAIRGGAIVLTIAYACYVFLA